MGYRTAWQDENWMSPANDNRSGELGPALERSDLQLVELVLAGSEAAFEDLFERHKRMVAGIAGRYMRRPEEVEEIIQIAFAKMYFELKNFRGRHEMSLAGWLAQIAKHACLDRIRSQRRRSEDKTSELPAEDGIELIRAGLACQSGERAHIDKDLAGKLLARLGDEDRLLLRMLHVDELSVAEAARAFDWSVSKTKVRAWRARGALRKIVDKLT